MYKNKDKPPPNPTYLSSDQMVSYLKDLRSQKTARPFGSRPPPPSKFMSSSAAEQPPAEQQASDVRPPLTTSSTMPTPWSRQLSQRQTIPDFRAKSPFAGRPVARPPSAEPSGPPAEPQKDVRKRSSLTYMENGKRWMEKQEARSLRMALEDMDLKEEKKIHTAAQDEAAELVWKHQHPQAATAQASAPYANPDVRKDYRSHLRKGSYQRSHSQEQVPMAQSRQSSGGSAASRDDVPQMPKVSKQSSTDMQRKTMGPSYATMPMRKTRTPSGKSYGELAEAVADDIAKARRRTSSGNKRIMSGDKKFFMHPNDRIWEDLPAEPSLPPKKPETVEEPTKPVVTPAQPPVYTRKNPFTRVRMQQEKLTHSTSAPVLPTTARHNGVEIQKNAPSQSRKAWYMSNEPLSPTPPLSSGQDGAESSPKGTPTKDGKEIRSDDIRAATSKQRKDRSPNLPQPTMVSDKPGRPIVSFQKDWKPKEVVLEEMRTASAAQPPAKAMPSIPPTFDPPKAAAVPQIDVPRISVDSTSKPPIPAINVPDEPAVPSKVLPEEPGNALPGVQPAPMMPPPSIAVEPPSIPATSVSGPDNAHSPVKKPAQRPLPASGRPQPHHAATSPLPKSTPHITPSVRQTGVLCAHCALPIAGRILSAAGERFHPDCFVCHECNTNLELVAFYPEPEKQRLERLSHTGTAGQSGGHDASCTLSEWDRVNSPLRFYCHLDFHELFSPRCKSCKTPIEGEVVVACGAEWHVGHFFCAQCGDPFDAKTPFVEKDGYAWCVGCHTNRYSSKCRRCRKPVTEVVVKALGWDWHADCFVCAECHGGFDDGRYFLRDDSDDPVCVKCEEKRLKA